VTVAVPAEIKLPPLTLPVASTPPEVLTLPTAVMMPAVDTLPPMTLPVTDAKPAVFMLPPMTLPVADACPAVCRFPPMMLPVTVTKPVVNRLAPVTLPPALTNPVAVVPVALILSCAVPALVIITAVLEEMLPRVHHCCTQWCHGKFVGNQWHRVQQVQKLHQDWLLKPMCWLRTYQLPHAVCRPNR